MKTILTVILGMIFTVGTLWAAEEAAEQAAATPGYPIDFCIVSGEKLGGMGDPVKYDYNGREIEFCCSNCIATFEKEPAKYIALLDEGIIKAQSADYPLNTCVISGEELGGMGEPVDIVYNNELVRLCCNGCKKDFNKNPDKYMKMIHEARHAQMMNGDSMEKMHESMEKSESGDAHHENHEGHGH